MKKVLVVLIACFAFVGAACGGSDDGDSSSSDSKSASSSETVAKGDPDSNFCDLARKFTKDFADTSNATASEDQTKVFKDLRSAIDQLDKAAPDEIKADVKVVADSFRESDDILKKYDYDFTKVPEEESQKVTLQDPEVTASSNRVESYFEKTCGIDTDGDGDTDGVIATTTTAAADASGPADSGDTSGDGSTGDTTETTTGD